MVKAGNIIKLKPGTRPQLSVSSDIVREELKFNGEFYGLEEYAFDFEREVVYLRPEYAGKMVWGVDEVTEEQLNINVAYDPKGVVGAGAFCSFVDVDDVIVVWERGKCRIR